MDELKHERIEPSIKRLGQEIGSDGGWVDKDEATALEDAAVDCAETAEACCLLLQPQPIKESP
jgi:hypothetical protein